MRYLTRRSHTRNHTHLVRTRNEKNGQKSETRFDNFCLVGIIESINFTEKNVNPLSIATIVLVLLLVLFTSATFATTTDFRKADD